MENAELTNLATSRVGNVPCDLRALYEKKDEAKRH